VVVEVKFLFLISSAVNVLSFLCSKYPSFLYLLFFKKAGTYGRLLLGAKAHAFSAQKALKCCPKSFTIHVAFGE